MRARLEQAMRRRAERRQADLTERLEQRRDGDADRAHRIFEAFRANLTDSLQRLREAEEEAQWSLLPDDQHRQRAADIRSMEERLLTLSDEEQREIAAIRERYADVQPFVSAAAVVFALTPGDAAEMGGR